jgi:hypothetical protein
MSKIIAAILITFLAGSAMAQDDVYGIKSNTYKSTAIKKADRIIISNEKSSAENFLLVKQILSDSDIEIASQDKEIFQIKSGQIPITRGGASSYYNFNCRQGKIVVTGFYKGGYDLDIGGVISKDEYTRIQNRGMGGSITKEAWNKMDIFSQKLGDRITYEISK